MSFIVEGAAAEATAEAVPDKSFIALSDRASASFDSFLSVVANR